MCRIEYVLSLLLLLYTDVWMTEYSPCMLTKKFEFAESFGSNNSLMSSEILWEQTTAKHPDLLLVRRYWRQDGN